MVTIFQFKMSHQYCVKVLVCYSQLCVVFSSLVQCMALVVFQLEKSYQFEKLNFICVKK